MAKMQERSIRPPVMEVPPVFPPPEAQNGDRGRPVIRAVDFKVINFFDRHAAVQGVSAKGHLDKGREVILIYALGEDGVVREFANGKWVAFPIHD
jgi:hypothetical protein